MKREETRQRLIDGTIQIIATEGLDKATTKLIGTTTGINEAYIYRCFKDKEDKFAQVFEVLDEELVSKTMQHLPVMMMEIDIEARCRVFFKHMWDFLLGNRDRCLTYIRYFYSPYFLKYSAESHEKRFIPTVERLRPAFIDEADVWMILNHILNVMFDFAIKVHHGQMSESDDYTEHVFRVTYASVKQYFKNTEEIEK